MLKHLFIKNIALIDKIEVDFGLGLNVLTGETGAGKSIIIDSINAVLGSRVSKDLIRTGQETARVEAFFEAENDAVKEFLRVNELIDEDDSQLILSREFNIQGKNVCRINGRVVPVAMLKELGQLLVDIHGQHDNQSLLNTNMHIDLLDSFGGDEISKPRAAYVDLYEKVREAKRKIESLGGDTRERERKLDLLRFQLDEIDAAKIKKGEDEELETRRNVMINASKMVSSVEEAYDILYAGSKRQAILDGLNIAIRELGNIQRFDEKVGGFAEKLQTAYYTIEEAAHEIRDYKDSLEFDPNELNSIEERLDDIYKLKKKYGNTITEILDYSDGLRNELEELEGSQEKLEQYSRELEELQMQMHKAGAELSDARKIVASGLEHRVVKELEDLEMKRTQFKVEFAEGEAKYTPKGIDNIEFLISPNAGESLKPLSKIASGGEMSRIMLAIKTILADVDEIPSLIFDEIDIGVSGKVAQMVGQKMAYIAKSHQVFAITHLPQIASMADNHYLIEKHAEQDRTVTNITELDTNGKMQEIARILGGAKITETTLKHAEEMLEMAQERKRA